MSSVVFNANAVGKAQQQQQQQLQNIELFPTTIGGATKMYQRYQHIMPAPEQIKESNPNANLTIKTRKYSPRAMVLGGTGTIGTTSGNSSCSSTSSISPYNVDQSQSVQRRNARERNRVKQVNNSFARLRQHIPQSIIADLTKGGGRGPHKKISKVDTLRIAVEYIRRLQDLVDDLNGGPSVSNNLPQLNLCLDETSSQSSNSSESSSVSSLGHHLYYSSSLAATPTVTVTPLQQQQQLQRQQFPHQPLTPISLNPITTATQIMMTTATGTTTTTAGTTCHSPTSSFNSSMSFDSGTYEAAPQQLSPPVPTSSSSSSSSSTLDAQLQLKFEPYEHFQLDEEDCTPDDEEILDYISLWQEQ